MHGEYRHLVHHARARRATSASPRTTCSSARTATSSTLGRRRRSTSSGARCRPATCTSTASSATSATACCATGATLAEEGVVVVIVTVDSRTGEIVTGPEIVTRGWVYAPEAEELLEEAQGRRCATSLAEARRRGRDRLRDDPPPRPPLARPVHRRAHAAPPGRHPGRHGSLTAYVARGWSRHRSARAARALVTGGGSGVGREICRVLVGAGAFVWVNDIYEDRAAKVAAELGGDAARASR